MNTVARARATDPADTEEVWRKVPGHSRYSVSNMGRVRRDVTVYRTRPGLCKLSNRSGYPAAALTSDEGKSAGHFVHHLVMFAFVGPRPSGAHICHWDGDSRNACLSNLRYDTPTANVRDAIRHGTQVKGEKVTQHILTEAQVSEIIARLDEGTTYIALGQKFGVTRHCIFRIAAGFTWRHITGGLDRRNGYKFTHIGGKAAKAKRDLNRNRVAV